MFKRAALALVGLGMAAATCAPVSAGTPVPGAVQMKWSVAATASMTLVTNYTAGVAAAQGVGANSLQPSAAGVCANQASETAFTMTFGAITPAVAAGVGCNYQRAVAATVTTNDSLGYTISEYLDQAPTAGVTFCAFKNNPGAATTNAPASVNAAAPAAFAAGACAAGGTALVAGTGAAGANPGNPGAAGLRTATAPGVPFTWASTATTAANLVYGEDIQLNVAANQASAAADTSFIIISLLPT
jgi:hypothetical protein